VDNTKDFYTTKLVLEVEISTQMGPDAAFNIIYCNLNPMPAVKSLKVLKAESNFKVHELPSKEFISVPVPAWVKK